MKFTTVLPSVLLCTASLMARACSSETSGAKATGLLSRLRRVSETAPAGRSELLPGGLRVRRHEQFHGQGLPDLPLLRRVKAVQRSSGSKPESPNSVRAHTVKSDGQVEALSITVSQENPGNGSGHLDYFPRHRGLNPELDFGRASAGCCPRKVRAGQTTTPDSRIRPMGICVSIKTDPKDFRRRIMILSGREST